MQWGAKVPDERTGGGGGQGYVSRPHNVHFFQLRLGVCITAGIQLTCSSFVSCAEVGSEASAALFFSAPAAPLHVGNAKGTQREYTGINIKEGKGMPKGETKEMQMGCKGNTTGISEMQKGFKGNTKGNAKRRYRMCKGNAKWVLREYKGNTKPWVTRTTSPAV